MQSLTPAAASKAYAALIAGILLAGLTAWREADAGGLSTTDAVIVVAIAVLPGIITWLAPANTPTVPPANLAP